MGPYNVDVLICCGVSLFYSIWAVIVITILATIAFVGLFGVFGLGVRNISKRLAEQKSMRHIEHVDDNAGL